MKTEWFPPSVKPVHVGPYEICFTDCGWQYEWMAQWDGRMWRNATDGWALLDQNQTWRGMTTESGE